MAYAMETLINRLNKKNEAIAKRAATTKKHAVKYLKNGIKPEWHTRWAHGDLETSTKELKGLIKDKREILKLIADAKANEIVLPEILDDYRKQLEVSFIRTRVEKREYLKSEWKNVYEPMRKACSYDVWDKMVNGKYRMCWNWDYKTHTHKLKKDVVIAEEDMADYELFMNHEKAECFLHLNGETMNETDESIAKRSAKDAKTLVEDLYKRTFGYTGKTTDYSSLRIDLDNNGYSIINGFIRGEKGACEVESISAGGYNIQCWHIRVLVKAR